MDMLNVEKQEVHGVIMFYKTMTSLMLRKYHNKLLIHMLANIETLVIEH